MQATFLAMAICSLVSAQQVAFTSRAHLQCPVIVTSTQESKTFGFESIMVQNDGAAPVRAVRFQVTLKTRAGEEITDDRRIVVDLDPRDHKRVMVDLGHIEGLKQKAKSGRQESGLAILTIAAVEFEDGTVWEASGNAEGLPLDAPIQPLLKR